MQIPRFQRVLSRKKEPIKEAGIEQGNVPLPNIPTEKPDADASHDELRLDGGQEPSTQVAHIYELLELILLELPVRDLLFAQLVCHTFKTTIDRSEPIQQRLFFRPQLQHNHSNNSLRVNNLLLQSRVFQDRMIMKVPGANSLHVLLDPSATTKPTHLFLKSTALMMRGTNSSDKWIQLNFRIGRYCSTWPFTKGCKVCNAPPLREGSWQRMYLTQPPVRIFCANGEGHRTWKNLNLEFPREAVGRWLTTGENFREPVRAKGDAKDRRGQDTVVMTLGQGM